MGVKISNFFFETSILVSSHMYPENFRRDPSNRRLNEHGILSGTARNRTHDLFRPKWEPIPLGHSNNHASSSFLYFANHVNFMSTLSKGWTFIPKLIHCHIPPPPRTLPIQVANFNRLTSNHPLSFIPDAQTISICHASPPQPHSEYPKDWKWNPKKWIICSLWRSYCIKVLKKLNIEIL